MCFCIRSIHVPKMSVVHNGYQIVTEKPLVVSRSNGISNTNALTFYVILTLNIFHCCKHIIIILYYRGAARYGFAVIQVSSNGLLRHRMICLSLRAPSSCFRNEMEYERFNVLALNCSRLFLRPDLCVCFC